MEISCACVSFFIYHNTLLKQHIRCVLVWHLTVAMLAWWFHLNARLAACLDISECKWNWGTLRWSSWSARPRFKSLDGLVSSYLSDLLGLDAAEWPLTKHCNYSKDLKLCCTSLTRSFCGFPGVFFSSLCEIYHLSFCLMYFSCFFLLFFFLIFSLWFDTNLFHIILEFKGDK